jgi:AcrR family transcriptional regulator
MATGDRTNPDRPNTRPPGPAEAIRDFVVEKVAEVVAEKAARQEQIAAKATRKAKALDRATEHINALDLWTRPAPITRRPRFTRDEIAQTAMRIADREGFAAVSMRRIANELDAGTMTLYHYIRTKDELLTVVVDAVMGEVVIPATETIPADWRRALTMVAERTRAALERHPWILDIADDPAVGPNSVRHFDQSLQAVASLQLPLTEKFDIVRAVDEYVFGYCIQHRNSQLSAEPSFDDDMIAYVHGLVETGDYPQLAAVTAEYGLEQGWRLIDEHMRDPRRFERNLARLLDGIAADVNGTATR